MRLLGEGGNWMRLRDSLFSWGSIWRSPHPALGPLSGDCNTCSANFRVLLSWPLPTPELVSLFPALAAPPKPQPQPHARALQASTGQIMTFCRYFPSRSS